VHQVFSLVAEAGSGAPRIASTWSKVISIRFALGGCLRNHSTRGRYLLNSGCLGMAVFSKEAYRSIARFYMKLLPDVFMTNAQQGASIHALPVVIPPARS